MPIHVAEALERCLLGALLCAEDSAAALEEADAALPPLARLAGENQIILDALRVVAARGEGGPVALAAELRATGRMAGAGGVENLARLIEEVPAFGVASYARDIARGRARERALAAHAAIGGKLSRGEALDGDLDRFALAAAEAEGTRPAVAPETWESVTGSKILKASDLLLLKDLPIPYLIEPLAIRGCLTQLHGPAKGGKSTFGLYLAVQAAMGQVPDGSPITIPDAIKVLYVTWEDSAQLIGRRICQYTAGMGQPGGFIPENLHVVESPNLWLEQERFRSILEAELTKEKYELIFIDTLSYAHSVDENSADEIKPVMAGMREIARRRSASVIYIHHRRKSSDGVTSTERARGSTAISAAADIIIDWGDHGDTDISPVSFRSKWGESATWEVEYIRLTENAIRWEIRVPEKKEKKEGNIEAALQVIVDLSPANPGGVKGSIIHGALEDQGVHLRTSQRYLKELVEAEKISKVSVGGATLYSLK